VNLYLLIGVIVVCLILNYTARISIRQLWSYIKIFGYLIVALVIVQGIFYPYKITYPLLKIPPDSLILANHVIFSLDGVVYGLTLGLRVIALVLAVTIFSLTTAPRDFLVSLRRIKVPFELAFMVNIALRFIPDIKDKASEIMLAQTARGLELEKGSIWKRIKNLLPVLTPLLINYLLMARNSAVVMETRAFRWKNERTYMRTVRPTKTDYSAIIITLSLTIVCGTVFWLFGSSLKVL
jgi:energy-coupling factor transport system permease protein